MGPTLEELRELREMQETDIMTKYTEGICNGEPAIFCEGKRLKIEEVVRRLNHRDLVIEELIEITKLPQKRDRFSHLKKCLKA